MIHSEICHLPPWYLSTGRLGFPDVVAGCDRAVSIFKFHQTAIQLPACQDPAARAFSLGQPVLTRQMYG
jgi:hypothetical protein